MEVKIEVKIEVGKKVALRTIDMDWWDELDIQDIANDINDAILNIE